MLKRLSLFATVLLFAACAQLGLQTPQTFDQKLAAGYVTVQTVAETATAAYTAGKLKEADRTNVVTTTRAAITGLDLAKTTRDALCPPAAGPTCTAPAADAKLAATMAILTALQAYLATQQGK